MLHDWHFHGMKYKHPIEYTCVSFYWHGVMLGILQILLRKLYKISTNVFPITNNNLNTNLLLYI